jgi:nucleoside 2-deoxyribosyltransferase
MIPEHRMRKIYLAGPDVFLPDAIAIGRRKKELCAQYGFEGLYPFDNEIDPNVVGADKLIYRANEKMIKRADLGIFNLTPFRGPSADVGTVFELGAMVGLGKPVFGYTNVAGNYLDRYKSNNTTRHDAEGDKWYDANGMFIEDYGNADNLMIDNALADHGRPLVRHRTTPEELFRDLTGFEACLQLAVQALSKSA